MLQVLEFIQKRMGVGMKVHSKTLSKAERECKSLSVVTCIKEITKSANSMGMVSIFGAMAVLIKAISKTA